MESRSARVSAVIVHYRTPSETVRAALAVAGTAPDAEIVVVDNASGDDITLRLAAEVPKARVLVERENRGYGAGCNRGARETTRPCILFLNSDAYIQPGAVAALVEALDANPEAAAVGPRLFSPDGAPQSSIRRLPTPWRIFCESSGLAFLSRGRGAFRGHTATWEDHEKPREVEALMGAALLLRRSAFEEVGGFDEGYFLYAEETDLISRWQRRGYRILFDPRARVIHVGGASSGDLLFGELHAALAHYVEKFHGPLAGRLAARVLAAGAALRYAVALVTPGGGPRRRRYRAALSCRARMRKP